MANMFAQEGTKLASMNLAKANGLWQLAEFYDWNLEQIGEADRFYEAAADKDPKNVKILNSWALFREQAKKDRRGSLDVYTRMTSLFGEDASSLGERELCTLGDLFLEMRQRTRAKKVYEILKQINPSAKCVPTLVFGLEKRKLDLTERLFMFVFQ